MTDLRFGDRVRAFPVAMGKPKRSINDPRVVGTVVGMDTVDGRLVIMVRRSKGAPIRCEARNAEVLRSGPLTVPDTRPDLVIAVYGNGRAEARRRGKHDVLAEDATLAALVLRLVSTFSAGLHLDIRYDPHM